MKKQKKIVLLCILLLIVGLGVPTFSETSIKTYDEQVPAWKLIEFNLIDAPNGPDAWVGLFKTQADTVRNSNDWNSEFENKIMLSDIGSTSYFKAPFNSKPISYVIAIFNGSGDADMPVAISNPILVAGRYFGPNNLLDPEGGRAYEGLVVSAKRDDTYNIKREMNGGIFDPSITAKDIENYLRLTSGISVVKVDNNSVAPESSIKKDLFRANTETIFSNSNSVDAIIDPQVATKIFLEEKTAITCITTYHTINSVEESGKIEIRNEAGEVFGPWETHPLNQPKEGQRVFCTNEIYQVLPAGTYTLVDSNSKSWLHNAISKNSGMSMISGTPLRQSYMGNFGGKVLDYVTMTPIVDVIVSLYHDENFVGKTVTDKQGKYNIQTLGGQYEIQFKAAGYPVTNYEEITIETNNTQNLNVILSKPYK